MMTVLYCIAAGITGTFLMTSFISTSSRLTGYRMHVPSILGSMVTLRTMPSGKPSESKGSKLVGYILHYSIGIIFAVVYSRIFKFNIITGYDKALLFGFIAGLVAACFWFCALKFHPLAPKVQLNLYLLFIFTGHLVFALTMNATFRLLLFIFGTSTPILSVM